MAKQLISKIVAVLIILAMTMGNLLLIGTESYAAFEELEQQKKVSSDKNVSFDTYFYVEEKNVHSVTLNTANEAIVNFEISVGQGYLKDSSIVLNNANFEIVSIEQQSIEGIVNTVEAKKITLNQISSNTKVIVLAKIKINHAEMVESDYLGRETTASFTSSYTNIKGKTESISSNILVRIDWVSEASALIDSNVEKYMVLNNKTIIQTKVTSGINENVLPIKNTNIKITVPEVSEKKAEDVRVTAVNTVATNGIEDGNSFTKENYTYNQESGIVEINVNNSINNENKISWKNGVDEYKVTYIYDTVETLPNIELKLQNEITTYKETLITNQIQKTQEIALNGNNVDFNVQATESLPKGYMYANSNYETEYNSKWSANISYIDAIENLVFEQNTDKFIAEDGSIQYVNYYYKQIKISKANFVKILGEEGKVQIYNKDNLIGTINKSAQLDEAGNYVFNFSEQIANIRIQTSKPVSEGKIIIENIKAITATSTYNFEQTKTFRTIENSLVGSTQNQEVQDLKVNTNLTESQSKSQIQINQENLSTVVKNENIEIRAVLETDDITDDLYKNPTIEINLPEEVQNTEIKSANVLFNNQMQITSIEIINNRTIRLGLTGEQTEFVTDGNKGITVILNTDLTLNRIATNREAQVTMKVTNEKAVLLQNDGISAVKTNIVAPTGIIALNSVTNTKTGETATSLESQEGKGKLERKTEKQIATYTNTIINNNNTTISNVKIKGNIPYAKDSYGSTINAKLIEGVTSVEGLSYSVYYTENADATDDINELANGWSDKIQENSKLYLIILNNTISQGQEINFNYSLELPENLDYGEKAISSYKVEYTEGTSNAGQIASIDGAQFMKYAVAETEQEGENLTETATPVALTTEEGPVLEATLSNNINEEVNAGTIITYTLTIKNTGTETAENVKANIPVPDGACYVVLDTEEYSPEYVEKDNENIEIEMENIKANETITKTFELKAKNENKTINVYAKILIGTEESTITKTITNNITKAGKLDIQFEEVTDLKQQVNTSIIYFLGLYNISDETVKNATVKINIPDNVEYVETEIEELEEVSKAEYNEKNRILTIKLGDIESIQTSQVNYREINITVKPTKANVTSYLQAEITGDSEVTQYSTIKTINAMGMDMNVNVSSNIDSGYVNEYSDDIKYYINIKNNSEQEVSHINININLPKEFDYDTSFVNGEEKQLPYDDEKNAINTERSLDIGEELNIEIDTHVYIEGILKEDKDVTTKINIDRLGFSKEFNYILEGEYEGDSDDPNNPDNPTSENIYKISGTAWLDVNKDGSMGQDETKLSGITVKALNTQTGKIATNSKGTEITATTNENGKYTLEGLAKGIYTVIFEYDTSKYTLTEYQKQGVDESVNSNVVAGTYEGKEVATTNNITISNISIANINIGLMQGSNFDLSLNKKVSKISMANTKTTKTKNYDTNLAKIDLDYKYINNTKVVVEYQITVSNEGDIPGYATKIVDYLPKELDFSTELNKDWYSSGGNIETKALANTIINPGESASITLVLTKSMTENDNGIVGNTAEIAETYNEYAKNDSDSTPGNKIEGEDDQSTANVILGLKTGGPITYITLTITIMALVCIGSYEINKRVLKM